MSKRHLLVLYGGRSSEHEISCLSARSVLEAIDRDRYEVTSVGITREGRWTLTDGTITSRPGRALPEVREGGDQVALVPGTGDVVLVRLGDGGDEYEVVAEVDVAFPVLHGPYGEDGTVRGMLATLGIPYVGADVTASSLGMDKRAMKNAFSASGLRIVPHRVIRWEEWDEDVDAVLDRIERKFAYPLFTKPSRLGSSIGIRKVHDRHELAAGLKEALSYGRVAIVERAVEPVRELEVGVLGNADITVTAPGEIVPSHEFYDYEAKYLDASELIVPARISAALAHQVKSMARDAYVAIGCRGMARIDFFLSAGDVHVNEINTIPDLTPQSMFPRLWEAEGLDYPPLIDRLLDLALEAADADEKYSP